MKKLVLAITIATLAFSGAAIAQDNVGVYFDTAGDHMYTNVSEISVLHAYVIASDLTSAGVAGFELQLLGDGPLSLANFAYPAGSGAINVQSAPTFLVGFAAPIPAVDGNVIMMEFDVLVFSANTANWPWYDYDINNDYDDAYEARIFVNEIFFHSLPEGGPAYLDEEGEIKPLFNDVNEYRGFNFSVIEGVFGPVATDNASWDEVKSLYR